MSNDEANPPTNSLIAIVPGDVWRAIFQICVFEDMKLDWHLYHYPSSRWRAPLLLCQICSVWTSIAINSPELWNNVSVFIGDLGPSLPPKILELFLVRAGSLPLKVTLDSVKQYWKGLDVVRILSQNFYRAVDITVQINLLLEMLKNRQPIQESKIEDVLPVGAPLLQNLVLRGEKGSSIDPSISRIWTLSPNLRSVVFGKSMTFDLSYAVDTLQIPFAQLTTIHIKPRMSIFRLYDLLSSYKNLVDCTIGELDKQIVVKQNRLKPLILPNLQHLSMTARWGIVPFISCLVAPALTALDMQDSGEDWPQGVFASFLANSGCSLHHLGITVFAANGSEKLDCIRLLRHLTSLTVYESKVLQRRSGMDFNFHYSFLEELGKWDESKREFFVLPRLERITIDYDAIYYPENSTTFANIVEDRWIRVKVTNLHFEYPRDDESSFKWAPNEILRLLFLKRDGLTVELDPVPEIEMEVFHPRRRLRR